MSQQDQETTLCYERGTFCSELDTHASKWLGCLLGRAFVLLRYKIIYNSSSLPLAPLGEEGCSLLLQEQMGSG